MLTTTTLKNTYMDSKKENFLRIYSDLPLGVRQEIILILNDQPITWNVAFIEVDNNTEIGETILEKLKKLEII